MAFDFPDAPAQDEAFTPAGGPTFTWNGYAWVQSSTQSDALTNIVQTILTTSGTYNKPTGLKFVEVTIVGGGGGSRGASATTASQSSAAGGGGGAGAAIKLYAATDLATSEPYTIGAGGAAAAAGGASTFKGLSAGGGTEAGTGTGAGGLPLASSIGGAGGVASGGDLNINGGNGGFGLRAVHNIATISIPGNGGASYLTSERGYTNHIVGANASAGAAGFFPGGGAKGAANAGGQAATAAGAAGGAGAMIIKEYF